MSEIRIKEKLETNVTTPQSGYATIFVDDKKLKIKTDDGNIKTVEKASRYIKKLINVQLDTPTIPVLAPNASHTYVINLGAEYEEVVISNFNWIDPMLSVNVPDSVIANGSFTKADFGGILIVNKKPGGWVRSFEINRAEFQNGNPTNVNASFSANSDDVSAPLGYGANKYEIALDHINIQTTPPKKLQIEDAYIDGQYLKITIKNCDTVPIDLSSYVGVTQLKDNNRISNMGAVSENGTLVYGETNGLFRYTENAGKDFYSVDNLPDDGGVYCAVVATNNSASTFLGFLNYQYVRIATSPNYSAERRFPVLNIPNINFTICSTINGTSRGDHIFDWKKTDTESCAIFTAFLNYTDITAYKSVDDCFNFGANAPDFDDLSPIFQASVDIADFQSASSSVSFFDGNLPSYGPVKAQTKVISENVHFLNLTYWGKPEELNNSSPLSDLSLGAQSIASGAAGLPTPTTYETRDTDIVLPAIWNLFVPVPNKLRISGSSAGNNGDYNLVGDSVIAIYDTYFIGAGTYGVENTVIDANEVVILKTDYDAVANYLRVSDICDVTGYPPLMVWNIRDVVIDTVDYKAIALVDPNNFNPYNSLTIDSNGGAPIVGFSLTQKTVSYRTIRINGSDYYIFKSDGTLTTEASSLALKAVYRASFNVGKQSLLKTTDGGATWVSIMNDDEFRYGESSVFHASNDGQTLLLGTMKYWSGPAYEKWPYPQPTYPFGSQGRFNRSNDGGATWVNASGNWTLLGDGLRNIQYNSIKSMTGQVIGEIDGELLAVLYSDSSLLTTGCGPILFRSQDNGVNWINVGLLTTPPANNYRSFSGDSKDEFMGFFGQQYAINSFTASNNVYHGALIESFTQWPSFGVK